MKKNSIKKQKKINLFNKRTLGYFTTFALVIKLIILILIFRKYNLLQIIQNVITNNLLKITILYLFDLYQFELLFILNTVITVVVILFTTFLVKRLIYKIKNSTAVQKTSTAIKIKNVIQNTVMYTFYVLLLLSTFVIFSYLFTSRPYIVENLTTSYSANNQIVFDVHFNIPVNTNKLKTLANSNIPIEVEYINTLPKIPYTKHIRIYVNQNIPPERLINPYFTNVSSLIGNTQNEYDVEYESPSAPQLFSSHPENNETDISINDQIIFIFDQNIAEIYEWKVDIVPYFNHQIETKNNKVIIKPTEVLTQSTQYKITLYRTPLIVNSKNNEILKKEDTEKVTQTTFATVKTPEVESFSPQNSYLLDEQKIEVQFNTPINFSSFIDNVQIEPQIEGEWTLKDSKSIVFKPKEKYQKDTKYSIVIEEGLRNISGGIIESKILLEFTTPGMIKFISTNPINGAQGISINTSSISILFDQPVDKKSVEQNFSINPNVSGNFSWNENKLIYTFNSDTKLEYSQTYTVSIKSGIKAVSGIDTNKILYLKFTTQQQKVLLNVPWLRQTQTHTCNVTATAMVLQYKGINATEQSIKNQAGIGEQLREHEKTGGNPYKEWVNYYGVYWTRISEILSSYGVSHSVKKEWNVVDLAKEIEKGNPVILWWQNGASDPYWKNWTTPDGTEIWGINGMHSEVVVGFTGPSSNPTGFYTNDPWRGKNRYYSVGTFKALWGRLRNRDAGMSGNIAIVIY